MRSCCGPDYFEMSFIVLLLYVDVEDKVCK